MKKAETMIESGHFYVNPGLEQESLQGQKIGLAYAQEWDEASVSALFIDDVNNETTKIGATGKLVKAADPALMIANFTSSYDYVFYESDMIPIAESLALSWAERGLAKIRRVRKTMNQSDPSVCFDPERNHEYQLAVSGVKIGTCDGQDPTRVNDLSCAMLDYTFLKQKANLAPHQVVILPETYQKQQKEVQKLIAKEAIVDLVSLTNVFFQSNQIETKEYSYAN